MIIKGIIDEDLINYKKPSMVIEFPRCDFKCDRECGRRICQNSALVAAADIKIRADKIAERYMLNDITQAIICQGLEPLDSWEDLYELISVLRTVTLDDIVIYTGYTEEEFYNKLYMVHNLKMFPNIIIKFGRFLLNHPSRYDEVLGVTLASDNQYARRFT